ncbi:gamma-glutamylcyclotransferase (GGCT)/AIG2-like uncharacterized protein YtfP [Alkalibacillus flavidus]|uniref:Gamma-glutamylcyclotransferase (GGCT)/AIG2-like uncharacterized protein YtfP n=1 Tax=Alkalibacillus flavidus TaxID=546021 RepID=A0ABV2KQS7_9BACI
MGVLMFVYGTLRHGERNHGLIEDERAVAYQASVSGKLVDTGEGFPAIVLDDTSRVFGEVYDVSENILAKVDALEGVDPRGAPFYDRKVVTVSTDHGDVKAYTYVMTNEQVDGLQEIASGDWRLDRVLSQTLPYYFAYGSCMDDKRIKQAGMYDEFTRLGAGVLDGYALRFSTYVSDGGRADIVEADESVEGVVYEITLQGKAYLYEREGVHIGKYRPAIVDVDFEGQMVPMLTFIVIDKQPEFAPPDHYLSEILRGGAPDLSMPYLATVHNRVEALRGSGVRT